MSNVCLYVHVVWCAKRREKLFGKPELFEICDHLRKNAIEKGIHLDFVNGHENHIHALISMGAEQNIAEIVKLLKGESAFWANNKRRLISKKLKWADDYYAASISKAHIPRIRNYIRNQEAHHTKKDFDQEVKELMEHYGFEHFLGDEDPRKPK